jgi:hypothetical protein
MDSDRFDGLVRTFGQTRSRRQMLRGLAGIAAAGVLLLDGREADAGKKRIGGSPCTKGSQCRTGKCVGDPGQNVCSCSRKKPACLQPDTSCQKGLCVGESCPGLTDCGGNCVDLSTDKHHCGSCRNDCTALAHVSAAHCDNGACIIDSCQDGFFDCDSDASTSCEADSTCPEICIADFQACVEGGTACCEATSSCQAFQPGCWGDRYCCRANGQSCWNACDCCSAASGGGCAFFNGGSNPGTCV